MTRRPICLEDGCFRARPRGRNSHLRSDYFCSRHDGLYEPLTCVCIVPAADDIGQCTRCWRPIPALHPIIAEALP
jgi:hypothetical protein